MNENKDKKSRPEEESTMIIKNPKMIGVVKMIDAIPQEGACPMGCIECFYNAPKFYRQKTEPKLPTKEEIEAINEAGTIVRVNSGHDSNVQKKRVIEATGDITDKFYNTAIAKFDFPGPVVFTCNGGKGVKMTDEHVNLAKDVSNLMFVRIRVNTWNIKEVVDKAVEHYTSKGVPVVLTFMRYTDKSLVRHKRNYEEKKSVSNTYWMITPKAWKRIMNRYKGNGLVFSCGTPKSSLCRHCLNCLRLYWVKKDGIEI